MGLGRGKKKSFTATKHTVTLEDGSTVELSTQGIGAASTIPVSVISSGSGSGNTKLVDVHDDAANAGFVYVGPCIISRIHIGNFSERGGIAVVKFNGKLWMIGGYDINFVYLNEVWSSSDGIVWQQENVVGLPAISSHNATVYNGEIWIVGGSLPNWSNNTSIYHSNDGINWSVISNPVFNGGTATRIAASSTKMMVIDEDVDKLRAWISTDGVTWVLKSSSIIDNIIPDLRHPADYAFYGIGSTFYVAGGQHIMQMVDHDVILNTNDDGVTWEGLIGFGFNGDWTRHVHADTTTYIVGGRHSLDPQFNWVFDANNTKFMGAVMHKREFDICYIDNKILQIAGQDASNGNNQCNEIVEIQFKHLYTK